MNDRQQDLLNTIITQYTKTAVPVGSKLIAENSNLELSSATIRNEMAELEAEGYIYQPHTSAGRVPTEKGYQFFVANFLKEKDLQKKQRNHLKTIARQYKKYELGLAKELAKGMAEISQGAIFIGSPDDVYYTGLSNLFSQPEFAQHQLVYDLSQVMDHLDQVISEVFSDVDDDVKILIGEQNPFGKDCSLVLIKYQKGNDQILIGILGPVRMDYQANQSLISYTKDLINNL